MTENDEYDPEKALWRPGRRSFLFLLGSAAVGSLLPPDPAAVSYTRYLGSMRLTERMIVPGETRDLTEEMILKSIGPRLDAVKRAYAHPDAVRYFTDLVWKEESAFRRALKEEP